MEDKNLYNKIMLTVFCVIVVLLCVGAYSWFRGKEELSGLPGAAPVQEVRAVPNFANV